MVRLRMLLELYRIVVLCLLVCWSKVVSNRIGVIPLLRILLAIDSVWIQRGIAWALRYALEPGMMKKSVEERRYLYERSGGNRASRQ
jgi:hypothetical protein